MSTANTFGSMQPNLKEQYSDGKKKKFQRTRKAMAELDASKDPMKALKDKSYLNLKGKKGVAV
jgi:hypothetical protein